MIFLGGNDREGGNTDEATLTISAIAHNRKAGFENHKEHAKETVLEMLIEPINPQGNLSLKKLLSEIH